MASSQMRNPHYSLTVAEVLDSPLGYLALMAVPVGLFLMFKILLWDYTVSQFVQCCSLVLSYHVELQRCAAV